MTSNRPILLSINCGSSCIRFATYEVGKNPLRRLTGYIDRMGTGVSRLHLTDGLGNVREPLCLPCTERSQVDFLVEWLEEQPFFPSIIAVGHRIMHGMKHTGPERITPALIAELHRLIPYAPDHLPREIALVEAISRRHPHVSQVACFETSFHRTLPEVARQMPIPRRYAAMGVEHYGFHGLSYSYQMEELFRIDPGAGDGRIILAHLGHGASMAAVRMGRSIDTSMAFSPESGMVMGNSSGDIDPGLVSFLARSDHLSAEQFTRMMNRESGLLGVSETSSDMLELLGKEATDERAAEAVALFCYQAKKSIGSYAAALGGLDTLVFSGGIGENSPTIRSRICQGLGFLGIRLDKKLNEDSAPLISAAGSKSIVRIIKSDEELMIARSVCRVLDFKD